MSFEGYVCIVRISVATLSLVTLLGTSAQAQDAAPTYSPNLVIQARPSDFVLQLPPNQGAAVLAPIVAAPPKMTSQNPVSNSVSSSVCDRILWSPVSLASITGLQCLRSEGF
jgi:hypothetical protein